MTTPSPHQPVLLKEVCDLLQPRPGDVIVDCNLGGGGHAAALLEACGGRGFLVGLDLDPVMISLARDRFVSRGFPSDSYALVHANHSGLAQTLGRLGLTHADRIVMDLGASSLHFDDPERGFSARVDGPLDMRYDRSEGRPTAADVVNRWEESDLARLFRDEGDEKWARRIARRIVERRAERPFERTADLAETVGAAIPRKAWPPKTHPATRVFLALRVHVNAEAESLEKGMDAALEALRPGGGRLAVVTFQSHEDRKVKRRIRALTTPQIEETDPWGRPKEPVRFRDLARRPVRAGDEELDRNPRARSAKLRGIEKL